MESGSESSRISPAQVLSSPEYDEACEILQEIFVMSRLAGRDPQAVFDLQLHLCSIILGLQESRGEAKKSGDDLGEAVARRLIFLSRRIGDGVAWRALNYDRVIIHLLSEHPNTGNLDDTVYEDLAVAKGALEDNRSLVLVNDLTNVLRHGDITILEDNKTYIYENKSGTASKNNRRSTRQKKKLEDLLAFLNLGVRCVEGRTEYIVRADGPLFTRHDAVSMVMEAAKKTATLELW